MIMLQRIVYSLVFVLTAMVSLAQSSVSGTVKDAQTREPLVYASVQIPGVSGATTNEQGNFSLNLPAGFDHGMLIVSFIGYQSDSIKVSAGQSKITVLLKPDMSTLQEVVVISGTMKEVTKM